MDLESSWDLTSSLWSALDDIAWEESPQTELERDGAKEPFESLSVSVNEKDKANWRRVEIDSEIEGNQLKEPLTLTGASDEPFVYPNHPGCQQLDQISQKIDSIEQFETAELRRIIMKHEDECEIDPRHINCAQGFHDLSIRIVPQEATLTIDPEDSSVKHLIEVAIPLNQEANRLSLLNSQCSDEWRGRFLMALATNLRRRYRYTSALPDIEEALVHVEQAIAQFPPDSPDRADALRLFAKCLRSHYNQTVPETVPWQNPKHYLNHTIELEREANSIAPFDWFHRDPTLLPDLNIEPVEDSACETVHALRLLVQDNVSVPMEKIQLLIDEHSNYRVDSLAAHRYCAKHLDEVAENLRDIIEEDTSDDFPDPSVVILIEEEAYNTSRTTRNGQALASYQLGSSLCRRDDTDWVRADDLERAAYYAIQAYHLGHDRKPTSALLKNIFLARYERTWLEIDRDYAERFLAEALCNPTTPGSLDASTLLRTKPIEMICPLAEASSRDHHQNWSDDKFRTLISSHSANRMQCKRNPFQCANILCSLVHYLDPLVHSVELIFLAIQEALSGISLEYAGQRMELLKGCAQAMATLSRRYREENYLNIAIKYGTEALDIYEVHGANIMQGFPPHHELAGLHLSRYLSYTRDLADLDRSICLSQSSLAALGAHETGVRTTRARITLCKALRLKFTATGDLQQIDEGIKVARVAYSSQGKYFEADDREGRLRALILEQLILSLSRRGVYAGEFQDLLEVTKLTRGALEDQPESLFHLRCYSNALSALPKNLVNLEDIDYIIEKFRRISDSRLSRVDLAKLLLQRYQFFSAHHDLEEAIEITKRPEGQSEQYSRDPKLGVLHSYLLLERSHLSADIVDADLALAEFHECIGDLLPAIEAPIQYHTLLARIHHARFRLATADQSAIGVEAVKSCNRALECILSKARKSIDQRELLQVALLRASMAGKMNVEPALSYYEFAINYLRDMISLRQNVRMRVETIKRIASGVAGDAATCAIIQGKHEKAIELLELGRSMFWQQALQLRLDTNNLQRSHPELASELLKTQSELESTGYLDKPDRVSLATNQRVAAESVTQTQRQLADKYQSLVDAARLIPGCEEFMFAKTFSNLRRNVASRKGFFVILTLSRTFDRCDALIILPRGCIDHLHLSEITPDRVLTLSKQHSSYIASSVRSAFRSSSSERNRGFTKRTAPIKVDLEEVLRLLWVGIALPIMKHLKIQPHQTNTPHMWWIPTDSFAGLPLHAAGIYSGTKTTSLGDHVVSSYLPTLASLSPQSPGTQTPREAQVLVISQPATPGYASIPATTLEGAQVASVALGNVRIFDHAEATMKTFLDALPTSHIVHVACHGTQNFTDPMKSAIMLYDGPVPISRIMRTPLPQAHVAFLSACETAMGDESLPDEVLHLSAAFIFAGFQNVIGTMWSIQDEDGPTMARCFYQNISDQVRSRHVGDADSGRALHESIQELRRTGVGLIRWVPFVHIGS